MHSLLLRAVLRSLFVLFIRSSVPFIRLKAHERFTNMRRCCSARQVFASSQTCPLPFPLLHAIGQAFE